MMDFFNRPAHYRTLTPDEIEQLTRQGCKASNWEQIHIHPETDLSYIHEVSFSGCIHIGLQTKSFSFPGGVQKHSGIYRATLHNVAVGNHCLIEQISGYIAQYKIEDECVIRHADTLVTEGISAFGNGVEITVLSETGGREIVMHDRLSAHEAYLQAMYRHDDELISGLRDLAEKYVSEQKQRYGTIQHHTQIARCGILKNLRTGPYSCIEGASCLENGTLCSSEASPACIGEQVIARDFIAQEGCQITDGCTLTRCHVGQSSVIGRGFSATDVYFGCNCHAENGEACAVFAGPYTVTHHKSTLLIGAMFSFMNAGSGSNQSNHMYKLGPSHQGILERGCKTSSDSYLLWPARVGAFSMIMGHYTAHADTGDFPFSYLIAREGGNYLTPGITLRNVGTARDIEKWPRRDKRPSDIPRTDHIVFDAFSPYTMGKMQKGLQQLHLFARQASDPADTCTYQNLTLKSSAITQGIQYYQGAIDRFAGEQLLLQLQAHRNDPVEDLYDLLLPSAEASGEWADWAGLLVAPNDMRRLIRQIKDKRLTGIAQLNECFSAIHRNYAPHAWAWTWQYLQQTYPPCTGRTFPETICLPVLEKWHQAVCMLNKHIIQDAQKEFDTATRIGFGIDGDEAVADADFRAVRGCAETNEMIRSLARQSEEASQTWEHWKNLLTI